MDKKREFDKIVSDIKSIKIQGARNVAKSALKAYSLIPTKSSKEKLIHSRPTEPMMFYALNLADKKIPISKILEHFDSAQNKINDAVFKLIKSNDIIFTHCHSTNVSNALIYSHKKGKKFEVYNTETRPLFQGRKTAEELKKVGIKITMFVDSALNVAISGEQGNKKVDRILIGADALLKDGIINKIGSELVSQIAKDNKVPVYIVADSWKFSKSKIKIEQRNLNEVWDNAPKNIKIKNPAFEFVSKKLITGIITEYGLMKYDEFLRALK
jgi:translation initiation factor 2B subunit (eIF-2B alpha/beta/delta family)